MLLTARLRRMGAPGGSTPELAETLSHLYQLAGRHDLALELGLRLRRQDVFDFAVQHRLLPSLRSRVRLAAACDCRQKGVALPFNCYRHYLQEPE